MDKDEITIELINYLNERGQFQDFLAFMEARGFDRDELESDIDKIEREA